jgi:hypothetical protein
MSRHHFIGLEGERGSRAALVVHRNGDGGGCYGSGRGIGRRCAHVSEAVVAAQGGRRSGGACVSTRGAAGWLGRPVG